MRESVNSKRMCLCWLLVRDGPGSQLASTSKALPACLERTCTRLNPALITQGVEGPLPEPSPCSPLPRGHSGSYSSIQPKTTGSQYNFHCRTERQSHYVSAHTSKAALTTRSMSPSLHRHSVHTI